MSQQFLVSVCIPTFNGAKFIAETIRSILRQTYTNLEIIVSDDNSTDNTLAIVERFNQKTSIPIKIFNHKPQGIGANWNNCIRKASGMYVKFLFQDDILKSTSIEKMVNVLQSGYQIGLVSCKRDFIIEKSFSNSAKKWIETYKNLQVNLKIVDKGEYFLMSSRLFRSQFFLKKPSNKVGEPSTYLFEKKIINDIGFFREDLRQILDYEFCYRILKKKNIAIIKEKLVLFRLHENQTTNQNNYLSINDYDVFSKIIFEEYFWFLNTRNKIKTLINHNMFVNNLYKFYKNILKHFNCT